MAETLADLAFDEWLTWVFDHPVTDPQWYWDDDAGRWDGPASTQVDYLARLFQHPTRHLEAYSDAQAGQGLWFLAQSLCSYHMYALLDERVPWPGRRRCVRAMLALFSDLFARRCSPHLSHLNEPGSNPLNIVCYMWWDLLPFGGPEEPPGPDLSAECLDVMVETLQLDSDACRESALHGLGHWRKDHPGRATSAIDAFLDGTPDIRNELAEYARQARQGTVL